MSASSPGNTIAEATAAFWARLDQSLAEGTCLAATFSKHRAGLVGAPDKLTFRPTLSKGSLAYQWATRRDNRETHENLSPEVTGRRIRELLETTFERVHVFTTEADFAVRVVSDGGLTARQSRPTKTAMPLEHNRSKTYLIPENVPCPFLAEIGVMTPAGKVRASKYAKFRQINRFLELVHDVIEHLPPTGELRIVDFGCGKSYLTFALHHLLTQVLKREVNILGFDRNSDVVATCERLSHKLKCRGLEFRTGEISGQKIEGTVDLAVSLHACDTATDDALAQAVAWQAAIILSVPCCQHELAQQINAPDLAPIQQHGILHEQFASLATDALRAQALEACGYKTRVLEFIDLEHTAKNLLIRAVRRLDDRRQQGAAESYDQFKRSLGLGSIASDRIIAQLVQGQESKAK
jgi:SAM-dependent methyltransferase